MSIKNGTKKLLKKIFRKKDFSGSYGYIGKNEDQSVHFEAFGEFLQESNINPLISAAYPLFLLFVVLKKTKDTLDIAKLRDQLVKEIRKFERRASKLGYSTKTILAARYCLCTMLDEGILSTKWGQESVWSRQCLLSIIHKETWGGERFYIILEELAKNLEENADLLELLYLILSQGFEGKYYNNIFICNEIRSNLFQKLSAYRGRSGVRTSLTVNNKNNKAKKGKGGISAFSVVFVVFAFLLLITMVTNYQLEKKSVSVFEELNKI